MDAEKLLELPEYRKRKYVSLSVNIERCALVEMKLTLTSTIALRNGVNIPVVGFGTFQSKGETGYRSTLAALKSGYRHIDTAAGYANEEDVGKAIRDSGVPRKEIFVTSKLSPKDHGYEKALAAFEETMRRLNLDDAVLDLYLIHWPALTGIPKSRREASWKAFEHIYKSGRVRAIGVSNYTVRHLEEMLEYAEILPLVNQVELHPRLPQRELTSWCNAHQILVEAYSSLGQGKLIDNETVKTVAKRNGHTVAQVLLRWALQKQHVVLPKSSHEDRIRANTELFDWQLNSEDMAVLDALEDKTHFCWDPTDVA